MTGSLQRWPENSIFNICREIGDFLVNMKCKYCKTQHNEFENDFSSREIFALTISTLKNFLGLGSKKKSKKVWICLNSPWAEHIYS